MKRLSAPLIILAVILGLGLVAGAYQLYARNKLPTVPDAPPTTIAAAVKTPQSVVTSFEKAVRKKDAKTAWYLIDEAQRPALDFEKFEKAVKNLPASYKSFKIVSKVPAKKHKSYSLYAKNMDKKLLDKGWFVTSQYPGVKSGSKQTIFLIIPRGGGWRILDMR